MSKSVKKKVSKKVVTPDPDPGKVVEESPKPVVESPTKRVIAYLSTLLKAGKYTRKDLIEKAVTEVPELKKVSVQTLLTDSKNPKYNKFPKLVQEKEGGILGFVDSK